VFHNIIFNVIKYVAVVDVCAGTEDGSNGRGSRGSGVLPSRKWIADGASRVLLWQQRGRDRRKRNRTTSRTIDLHRGYFHGNREGKRSRFTVKIPISRSARHAEQVVAADGWRDQVLLLGHRAGENHDRAW
jgi:hypothetical protein